MKQKVSRRKEAILIKAEINKIRNGQTEKISETKSCFFKKINKVDKSPVSMLKEKNTHKDQQERWAITTDPTDIKRKMREYEGNMNNFMPKKIEHLKYFC